MDIAEILVFKKKLKLQFKLIERLIMLVLSRRLGEKIIIGDREVEMVVISYDKGQVKLGFEADKRIKINREEVYVKIENEKKGPPDDNDKKK